MDDLTQIAALPLNSHLKIDPWDDKVFQLNVKPAPLLSARDKMPFEVTPIYYRLQRYQPPVQAAPSSTAAAPANTAPTPANAAPAPATADPANADPAITQPPPPPADPNQTPPAASPQ
jgi:hypothetical protein